MFASKSTSSGAILLTGLESVMVREQVVVEPLLGTKLMVYEPLLFLASVSAISTTWPVEVL